MAEEGVIESVAKYHYAFQGSTAPEEMEAPTRQMAGLLKADGVNAVLLVPTDHFARAPWAGGHIIWKKGCRRRKSA